MRLMGVHNGIINDLAYDLIYSTQDTPLLIQALIVIAEGKFVFSEGYPFKAKKLQRGNLNFQKSTKTKTKNSFPLGQAYHKP